MGKIKISSIVVFADSKELFLEEGVTRIRIMVCIARETMVRTSTAETFSKMHVLGIARTLKSCGWPYGRGSAVSG
jgi:hypothetical protein